MPRLLPPPKESLSVVACKICFELPNVRDTGREIEFCFETPPPPWRSSFLFAWHWLCRRRVCICIRRWKTRACGSSSYRRKQVDWVSTWWRPTGSSFSTPAGTPLTTYNPSLEFTGKQLLQLNEMKSLTYCVGFHELYSTTTDNFPFRRFRGVGLDRQNRCTSTGSWPREPWKRKFTIAK